MKWIFLTLFVIFASCPSVLADGYPFDPDSQRVSVPSLRLKLNDEQIREVSATGILTFSGEHLRLVRLFYPAATHRTGVVTATFNDNIEGGDGEGVDCFWVAPDEVAITLNEKYSKDKSPFYGQPTQSIPTGPELKRFASRHVRLGPDGTIYFQGLPISLERTFGLIDEIARYPKPDRNHENASNSRVLSVVVPPPATARELREDNDDMKPTPKQIFDALVVYGAAKSIGVQRDW